MIRIAKEGEITWLKGLKITDLPYPLPSGITPQIRGEELGIEVQGVVGAIPFRNGDTLQIIPKIGSVNFLRLLFKAEGYQPELEREYDQFVSYSLDEEQNIDVIVARHLLYCAEEILRKSPHGGRISNRKIGTFAAGQIDALATAVRVACHAYEPVVYFSQDRTEDIVENRVITEAILRAWPLLDDDNRHILESAYNRWIRRFPGSYDLELDLSEVERGFAIGKYGGARDYYRKALMLSQIILGASGIGFKDASNVEGDAVLLRTADVFEKYLRNVITTAYNGLGYIVTKGSVGFTSLYTDGSFELIPDIVITKDNKTLLIIDAKYKVPTASDHYQMIVYLTMSGIRRGILLTPLYEGDEVRIKEYMTPRRMTVHEIYLPMSNLNSTEKFLGKMIAKLVV